MSVIEFREFKLAEVIKTIYPPILLAVGIVGNVLAVAVLAQARNRRSTTGMLLISLAITDSLILLGNVLVNWIVFVFKGTVDVRNDSDALCKVHVFATYLLFQLSPWILVFVTIERAYSVVYPHRVRDVFTRKRVILLLIVLVLLLSGLNGHLLYGTHLEFDARNKRYSCIVQIEHEEFMFTVWPWIDFAIAFAIPLGVYLIGNIIIVVKLRQSHMFRGRSANPSENGRHPTDTTFSQDRNGTSQYFTAMAVCLNITFMLFVSPFAIFAIGQPYWFPVETMTPQRHARLIFIGTITTMLMYTNNGINFILYILCGSRFRKDVVNLLRCSTHMRRSTLSVNISSIRTGHSSIYNTSGSHTPAASSWSPEDL